MKCEAGARRVLEISLWLPVVGLAIFLLGKPASVGSGDAVRQPAGPEPLSIEQKKVLAMNVGSYRKMPIGKQLDLGLQGAFLSSIGARPTNDAEALYYRCFGVKVDSGRYDNIATVILLTECAASVGIIRPK